MAGYHRDLKCWLHRLVSYTNVSSIVVIMVYWFDMKIYLRVLVTSNFARRYESNINYAPKREHIFPYLTNNLLLHTRYKHKQLNDICYIIFIDKMSEIASKVNKKRLKIKTKVNRLLPRPFLSVCVNVYSKEFHSHIWEHLQICICIINV